MKALLRNRYPLAVIALVAVAAAGAGYGFLSLRKALRAVLPDVTVLQRAYPVVAGKDGKDILFRLSRARPPHWRSLSEISRHAVTAVLLSEDAGFYRHGGYDPEAIRDAWEHNHRPGVRTIRGGSTITQQVVKNVFLTPEKTLTRKLRELILAVELERALPKKKILEIYLNVVEWGPGIFGIERASRHYFGKPASGLSAREGALLAFLLPNPARYRHGIRPDGSLSEFASGRVETILTRMMKTGHLTPEELSSYLPGRKDPVSSSL